MQKFYIAAIVTILLVACFATHLDAIEGKPALLVVYNRSLMAPAVDTVYRAKLEKLGFQIHAVDYSQLNWDVAKQFNVIALLRPGSESNTSKVSIAERFVEEGGGLLVFNDPEAYIADIHGYLNAYLKPFGARYLDEQVFDPEHAYLQRQPLFKTFYYTRNITQHPITKGVKEFWYVGEYTNPTEGNDQWDVVVKGEPSAYSSEDANAYTQEQTDATSTYSTAPPLVLARTFKKGRIVIMPTHSTFWIQAGFHELWEEGILFNRGDGGQLMLNVWNWLAEPSLTAGNLGGYVESAKEVEKGEVIPVTDFAIPATAQRIFPAIQVEGNPSPGGISNFLGTIEGTHEDAKFKAYDEGTNFSYKIPMPTGKYQVALGFLTGKNTGSSFTATVNGMSKDLTYSSGTSIGRTEIFNVNTAGDIISIEVTGSASIRLSLIQIANDNYYAEFDLGSYKDPSFATPETVTDENAHSKGNWKKGVIGVHTTYSDGKATVAQYAKLAKQMGFDYIVFTDTMEDLDEQQWAQLRDECNAVSDENFVAIPGFSGIDGYNNHYFCFNTPNDRFLTEKEKETIYTGGAGIAVDFNMGYPNITFTNLEACGWYPWLIKFYTGLDLFTYDNDSKLISDGSYWYKNRVFTSYFIAPLTSHRITDLDGLRNAKGFFTYVNVPTNRIRGALKGRSTVVSSGPLVDGFSVRKLTGRGDFHSIEVNVTSGIPLKTVTILDKGKIYRQFYPDGKEFYAKVPMANVGYRNILIEAEDVEGHKAYSWREEANNQTARFSVYMCADQQNTIETCADFAYDDWVMTKGLLSGWDFWGARIMIPEFELMPWSGFEGLFMQMGGYGTDFAFYGKDGMENPIPERNIRLSNDDVTVVDNDYYTQIPVRASLYSNIAYMISPMQDELADCKEPTTQARSLVRYISFRPRLYSYNIMMVDAKTEFLKDVTLEDKDGLEVILTNPFGKYIMKAKSAPDGNSRFPQYSYIDRKGDRIMGDTKFHENVPTVKSASLAKNGFAAIWPDHYGALGVFAVTPREYDIAIGNTYDSPWREDIAIGFDMPNETISEGTIWRDKFLVMVDDGKPKDDAAFREVYDLYGFDGMPAYSVAMTKGTLNSDVYALDIDADEGEAAFKLTQADLPEPLGIMVNGMVNNWDGAVYDGVTFKRIEIYDGTAYTTVDISDRDKDVFVGHLVQCDNDNIVINVLKPYGNEIVYEVHNPTDTAITTHVVGTGEIVGYENIDETIELKPGQTISKIVSMQ